MKNHEIEHTLRSIIELLIMSGVSAVLNIIFYDKKFLLLKILHHVNKKIAVFNAFSCCITVKSLK